MSKSMHAPQVDNRIRLARILGVFLFAVPLLIYLPTFGGSVAVPPGGEGYSDLLISHYPNLVYLQKSIFSELQIPWWSTMIQSGTPFAANPLAGLFYLPGWIAMFLPLPAGLNIMVAVHIIFGMWGMYIFLGQKGCTDAGRYFGALCFGLMPKFAAHFGAGHVSLIYAISWTPWLLLVSEKDRLGWRTGAIAGMLFLADPRWSIYAGGFWLTYKIAHRQKALRKELGSLLRTGLTAFLISAPLLLPLLEFVRLSTRNKLTSSDILTGSLPLENLIGISVPGASGNTEWYVYVGGVLLALCLSQLFVKYFWSRNRFWIIWLVLSILLAVIPGLISAEWLDQVPIVNLLRVPARSMFLLGISLAVLGAMAFDNLDYESDRHKIGKLSYFGIIVLGLMMIGGMIYLTNARPLMLIWGFVFITLAGFVLLANHLNPELRIWKWLLAGLLILDFVTAGWSAYQLVEDSPDPKEIINAVIDEEGYFRFYSPSYSVPQSLAAELNFELADGVDPLQIASYVDFMDDATGVEQDHYSVTIPPFRTGDPSRDNKDAQINSRILGLLNVKYVVSEFEIIAAGLTPLSENLIPKVYLNEFAYPRAWVEGINPEKDQMQPGGYLEAHMIRKTPNRLLLEATGPGELVTAEINYPGWRVYVDGERQTLNTSYQILRSVSLPEGEHQVIFEFFPLSVFLGLGLAGLGWLLVVVRPYRKILD
jgi:hypothetical protein